MNNQIVTINLREFGRKSREKKDSVNSKGVRLSMSRQNSKIGASFCASRSITVKKATKSAAFMIAVISC